MTTASPTSLKFLYFLTIPAVSFFYQVLHEHYLGAPPDLFHAHLVHEPAHEFETPAPFARQGRVRLGGGGATGLVKVHAPVLDMYGQPVNRRYEPQEDLCRLVPAVLKAVYACLDESGLYLAYGDFVEAHLSSYLFNSPRGHQLGLCGRRQYDLELLDRDYLFSDPQPRSDVRVNEPFLYYPELHRVRGVDTFRFDFLLRLEGKAVLTYHPAHNSGGPEILPEYLGPAEEVVDISKVHRGRRVLYRHYPDHFAAGVVPAVLEAVSDKYRR